VRAAATLNPKKTSHRIFSNLVNDSETWYEAIPKTKKL